METNSQDSKPDLPNFWPIIEKQYGGMDDNTHAIDGMILAWNTYVAPLQYELSSLKEERDLLKAEVERLKGILKIKSLLSEPTDPKCDC